MRKISARPTKSFFINTLVKDIHLIDAILDLIDNAIDSYIRNDMKERRKIVIKFTKDVFLIEDYCGGIKKEEIYERVFRFGKLTQEHGRTISVFGIGLKRAVFKIGTDIYIETDDGSDYCAVRIDQNWLRDDDNWELVLDKDEKSKGEPFTRITISAIFPNIAQELANTVFENAVRTKVRDTYSIFMEDRIAISVNEKSVEPRDFRFLNDGKRFVPFHRAFLFDAVELEIYAGFTPIESENKHPYGWNIFCNDRLVVQNNTSEKTGWGGQDGKRYHYPEDNRFLGLAFFRSDNPLLLPWQTTKSAIQEDSRLYRRAQVEMRAVTNRLINVIRIAGRITDSRTGETIGKALFEDAASEARAQIKDQHDEVVPAVKGKKGYERLSDIPPYTTIQYTKKRELVKKVKKELGDTYMSNKNMGEMTFDYYVKMEGVEDE